MGQNLEPRKSSRIAAKRVMAAAEDSKPQYTTDLVVKAEDEGPQLSTPPTKTLKVASASKVGDVFLRPSLRRTLTLPM
jgi:hypothetical protein